MKREGDILYFDPDEDRKFLRAIRLFPRLAKNKYCPKDVQDTVEHEKAHIDMLRKLGIEEKIKGYSLHAGKTQYLSKVSCESLTEDESFRISLAPENPSPTDIRNVLDCWAGFIRFREFKENGGTSIKNFREIILAERGIKL